MCAVVMEYPESWLAPLGTSAEGFARDARVASAMKLFELGKLSSGQAAQLAGLSRVDFLLACPKWGVDSVAWDETECRAEFETPLQ